MDLLLPGYEHQIVAGAGLNTSPGRPKVVLHTTETPRGTANQLINHWRNNWGAGLPHFIVDGSRVVQLLPLNVGAYTLENAPGGADTNRSGPAIQAEICSYAANDWDNETYEAVGKLLADIKRAGHDFDLNNTPRWYGSNEGVVLATYNSPIRMSAQQYIDFNGWCAHQHCPENAHWDCGKKDTNRIKTIARAHYDGSGTPTDPTPIPIPPEEDIMASLEDVKQAVRDELATVVGQVDANTRKALIEGDGFWMGTDTIDNRIYLVVNNFKMHLPGSTNPDPVKAKAENDAKIQRMINVGFDNRGDQTPVLQDLPTLPFNDPDAD